ncbi:Energy-coupling factor transporter ATP-binding protein EcfA1 [Paenibacillus solanacearum]|uniref:Energy-coupling factor transporter ATP-binding protein EcfA1 n=1 Tax=Paenibacillus solanacearum TaxID=2048548 RepID=A0A916NKM4_9BACL|nr:ATP-binding cassette domain-containing protein [Paenibacillus solanacearum]CAG7643611.1 Energy-coupling factor transporter ATP-binding protein EcfA1 [Paenibacillus solanacearum]
MNSLFDPIIELQDLTLTYGAEDQAKPALRSIRLSIEQGEWIAVVGSNGCGKSTLAKVIAGLVRPSGGHMICRAERRPAVQLVFQNPETQMIRDTVYEEVSFGLGHFGAAAENIEPRAMAALRRVGLDGRRHARTAALSGGQKQLLNIASCLALKPAVYVFDESTSMLDPQSRQNVLDVVRELHREGRTIIWITQLLDELAWCDRVIGMEDGAIVFDESKQSFFYGEEVGGERTAPSPCEQLGFVPPFTVQTALLLLASGWNLRPLPVSPEELSKAVSAL